MSHLSEADRLNKLVTTMTCHVPLRTSDVDVPRSTCKSVISSICSAHSSEHRQGRRGFKNCNMLDVQVASLRGMDRRVVVKIFANLMLHVTGCHSLEMITRVVETVKQLLEKGLNTTLSYPSEVSISMVNYSYILPGLINLAKLVKHVTEHGYLILFDPMKYAGANIKLRIDEKRASIMVFKSGKTIISVPRTNDPDETLRTIIAFVETTIVSHWDKVRYADDKRKQ